MAQFKSNVLFCQQTEVFNSSWLVAKNDFVVAREKALVCLYGGSSDEGPNTLRYRRFCDPQTLPPAVAAAEYHNLRVYYQIMDWKGRVGMAHR